MDKSCTSATTMSQEQSRCRILWLISRVGKPKAHTCALCYDADTPDAWESLLDAARLLAEAGYLPLMEDPPAGRGGHLWMIYTRLVSAAVAQQHAVQVAPMLQHRRAAFPNYNLLLLE